MNYLFLSDKSFMKYWLFSFILFLSLSIHSDCNRAMNSFMESTSTSDFDLLVKLHPFWSKEEIILLEKTIDTNHARFRTYVPLFYHYLAPLVASSRLQKIKGSIVGDAHMENFGVFLNKVGKPIFTMNDFDDFAKGPIFWDLIRLLTSGEIVLKDLNFQQALKYYVMGLENKKHSYSKEVSSLLNKSQKNGKQSTPKVLSRDGRFIEKKDPAKSLTKREIQFVTSYLVSSSHFSDDVTLLDSYIYKKVGGGSSFLKRYYLSVKQNGKINLIELKERKIPSSTMLKESSPYSVSDFLKLKNEIIFNDPSVNSDQIIDLENRKFLVRERHDSNISIKLEKINKPEQLLFDELYTLGEIHRRSLINNKHSIPEYIENLEIEREQLKKTIRTLAEKFNQK